MSDISMDNVNIEIQSSSEKAAQGVDQLINTLNGLNSTLGNIQNNVNQYTSSLSNLTNVAKGLKTPEIKINSNIPEVAKELEYLNSKTPEIKTPKVDTGNIKKAADNVQDYKGKLQSLSSIADNTKTRIANMFMSLSKARFAGTGVTKLKDAFSGLGKGMANIGSNIASTGKKMLRLTTALFGIRSAFYAVRNISNEFLSSQDATAKQLSANISYLKFALGSTLAPVIEFITNLIYNLLKAIQSIVYFFAKINIFSRASAKNFAAGAGGAAKTTKELKKQLQAFDELNNISLENNAGGGGGGGGGSMPSFDLGKLDDTLPRFAEMILNDQWYDLGFEIGQKITKALESIPWDKIKAAAGKIGRGLALLLNGLLDGMNWNLFGKTFAEGLNTIIEFGYNFVTTFNWDKFGKAIGDTINGFFLNLDFKKRGQMISKEIIGVLTSIANAFETIRWKDIALKIQELFANIDFAGIITTGARVITSLMQGITESLPILLQTVANITLNIATGIGNSLPTLIPLGVDMIMTLVNSIISNIPTIIEAGINVLIGFVQGLANALPKLASWLPTIIQTILTAITTALPKILQAGIDILKSLIQGIINTIPKLVEALPQVINAFVDYMTTNRPQIIDTGIEMLIALIDGIIDAIPKLVEALPQIIITIITTLIRNLPKIIESGQKITESLAAGIVSLVWKLGEACVRLGMAIGDELMKLPSRAVEWGRDLIQGLINGIRSMLGSVGNAASSIANKIKSFLHFSRPDEGPLREYETWMPDMVEGLSKKMSESAPLLYNASKNLAEKIEEGLDTSNVFADTSFQINGNRTMDINSLLGDKKVNGENDTPIQLIVNLGNETLYNGMVKSQNQASNQYGVAL